MSTIALVACSKKKAAGPLPAEELYAPSALFSKSRAYALAHADRWLILSARHGLVAPDQELEPYDQRLGTTRTEREIWTNRVWFALRGELSKGDEVVMLAGRDYGRLLGAELRRAGYQVSEPMEGLGLGARLGWLSRNA